jgi:hypothetical protein
MGPKNPHVSFLIERVSQSIFRTNAFLFGMEIRALISELRIDPELVPYKCTGQKPPRIYLQRPDIMGKTKVEVNVVIITGRLGDVSLVWPPNNKSDKLGQVVTTPELSSIKKNRFVLQFKNWSCGLSRKGCQYRGTASLFLLFCYGILVTMSTIISLCSLSITSSKKIPYFFPNLAWNSLPSRLT